MARTAWLQPAELTAESSFDPTTADVHLGPEWLTVRTMVALPAVNRAGKSCATVSGAGSPDRDAMCPYRPSDGLELADGFGVGCVTGGGVAAFGLAGLCKTA